MTIVAIVIGVLFLGLIFGFYLVLPLRGRWRRYKAFKAALAARHAEDEDAE